MPNRKVYSPKTCRFPGFTAFNHHLLIITICCVFAFFLQGCSEDDEQTADCASKGLDSACYPKADTTGHRLPKTHIKQINFFIETSGSMHGYMPANATSTEFQVLIPDLLQRSTESYPVNLYTIFDSRSKFKKEDLNNVESNLIPKGNFEWSGNTYVPVMIDSLRNYLDSNKVNVFISDCIYSPNISNVKLTAQTISEIRGVVKPIADSYSTVIYMVTSHYYARNKSAVNSPYYLVLQGRQENLIAVEQLFRQSFLTFHQAFEEVYFGDRYPTPYYSVLPYTMNSGNFIGSKNPRLSDAYVSLQDIELSSENPKVTFWVGLDLQALPGYARTKKYLDSNLSVNISKGKVKITGITSQMEKVQQDDGRIAGKCDAFVQLTVDDMPENVALVSLSLSRKRPDWVGIVNHDDLEIKETERTKTFGWANIITGIEQAYNLKPNDTYFNQINISLIKKQ